MTNQVLLFGGLATLAAAWLGPLPELAERSFSAHMVMHMSVVAIAAPLLALAIAGSSWDPVLRAPEVFSPIPASLLEFLVVWAWHAPALHHAARHDPIAFVGEQSSFLCSGLFLWLSAVGGRVPLDRSRRGSGFLALLLTSMHMTLLGALLALSPRPLYSHGAGLSVLTAIEDQHIGGAVMLLVGGVSYLAGGLWIMTRLLHEERPDAH